MATPVPVSSWPARFEAQRTLGTSAARALVERLFQDHPTRRFAVRLWDGSEVSWGPQRDFTLVFRDRRSFLSLIASRDASELAEAYVDGRLGIEGDVDAAVGLATYFQAAQAGALVRLARPVKRVAARLRSSKDDARDVHAHYDLSDDFFRLFLDRRMVYSCAYFSHPEQSLEEAQERKLDLVCRKLQLRPGDSFLDVGCGWGALVLWAAQRYGVVAHGITLSRNQADAARAAVARAGLSGRVTIEERHYKDLPEGAFDKIASVGMIEHVGIANYGAYFEKLERALRPGGLLLNHGITQPPGAPERVGGHFIVSRVFPGAEIDALSHTLAGMEDRGLEIVDVQSLRPHYALTLREWSRRYAAHREEAARFVPERNLRAWDLYLPGCRLVFEEGILSVHQSLAAKPAAGGAWTSPLTREETMLPRRLDSCSHAHTEEEPRSCSEGRASASDD
jgi:cyclopropane-fatty-acyl-phospholipid synthase